VAKKTEETAHHYLHEGLEQLSEKQGEEMQQMLARKTNKAKQPVHTEDHIRATVFSDLMSDIPLIEEAEQGKKD
jgi:hypothetical protein